MKHLLTLLAGLLLIAFSPQALGQELPQPTVLIAAWTPDKQELTIYWSSDLAGEPVCLYAHEPGSSLWTSLQGGQPCTHVGQLRLLRSNPEGLDQQYAARPGRTIVLLSSDSQIVRQATIPWPYEIRLPTIAR